MKRVPPPSPNDALWATTTPAGALVLASARTFFDGRALLAIWLGVDAMAISRSVRIWKDPIPKSATVIEADVQDGIFCGVRARKA